MGNTDVMLASGGRGWVVYQFMYEQPLNIFMDCFSHPGPLMLLFYTTGALDGPQTPRYNEAVVFVFFFCSHCIVM